MWNKLHTCTLDLFTRNVSSRKNPNTCDADEAFASGKRSAVPVGRQTQGAQLSASKLALNNTNTCRFSIIALCEHAATFPVMLNRRFQIECLPSGVDKAIVDLTYIGRRP